MQSKEELIRVASRMNPHATLGLEDTFLAILKKDKDGVWKLQREIASSRVY